MKKYFAVVLTLIIVAACFTACGGDKDKIPEVDGAQVVTDDVGAVYPVSTNENGEYSRNENGEIELIVTKENGKPEKDENGNVVTEIADLDDGVVLGNRAEYNKFSILIPDDWICIQTLGGCCLRKTTWEKYNADNNVECDELCITECTNTYDEVSAQINELHSAVKSTYPDTKEVNSNIEIKGQNCLVLQSFVPDNGSGVSVYWGHFVYQADTGRVYKFQISAKRDMTDDLDDIKEILGTIDFYE